MRLCSGLGMEEGWVASAAGCEDVPGGTLQCFRPVAGRGVLGVGGGSGEPHGELWQQDVARLCPSVCPGLCSGTAAPVIQMMGSLSGTSKALGVDLCVFPSLFDL